VAELTPIPSVQRPSDPGYKPVSGFAVAAGLCAAVFAVLLVALLYSAVTSSRAALSPEWLGIPILGIAFAIIGRIQIRKSEGTRTGGRIASLSWWVCVLGGVGFAAYIYANQMALEMESGKFVDQMFRELQAGRVKEAFENHLVPPEERGRVPSNSPDDVFEAAYGQSGYHSFRNHEVVRLFARSGQAVQFERVRVKESGQETAGLYATHVYRLRCPEGTFECQVKAVAAEAKKGGKPLWRIPAQPEANITRLNVIAISQYGRASGELAQEGEEVVKGWIAHVSIGHRSWSHLFTVSREQRTPIIDNLNGLSGVAGGPATLFPVGPSLLPADRATAWEQRAQVAGKRDDGPTVGDLPFEDLNGIGFFRRDDAGAPLPEEKLNHLRELWRVPSVPNLVFADPRAPSTDQSPPQSPIAIFKPDRILVIVSADLFAPRSPMHFRCAIAAECTDPSVLSAVNAARDRGGDFTDTSLTLATLPPRNWRVIWLRTDMEPLAPVGPGAPKR
jgi:hypothetical protein